MFDLLPTTPPQKGFESCSEFVFPLKSPFLTLHRQAELRGFVSPSPTILQNGENSIHGHFSNLLAILRKPP